MRLSRFFIDRPIFAAVLSLIIFIVGAIALGRLPISEYPEVVPPTVVVRAFYPGANPRVTAETVASPLEQQLNGVEGMLYVFSQSTADGAMTLTVTFALGTDLDNAQVQVQNRVAQALPRLPPEVQRIGVTTEKSSPDLLMVVHLVSPDDRYDMLYLSNFAHLQVRDELRRIAGVGDVRCSAAANTACGSGSIRIGSRRDVSPRPTWCGRSASRTFRSPPACSVRLRRRRTPRSSSPINTQGRLSTEEQFGDVVVRATPDGQITRLKDVARIELGASTYSLRSLLDNQPAAAIGIFQRPGSNALEASSQVYETMERLKEAFPEGLEYRIVVRPDGVRSRVDQGGCGNAVHRDPAGRGCRGRLPADLARIDHPAGGGARLTRRDVRRAALARLLAEHALVVRPCAGHRHRRRRCDCRRGERGDGTSRSARRRSEATRRGDGRSVGTDHRDCPRALRRLRAHGVHQRTGRPVLPAVRADHRHFDGDLGFQFAHPQPGAGVTVAAVPRRAPGSGAAGDRPRVRVVLPPLQSRVHVGVRGVFSVAWPAFCALRRSPSSSISV